MQSKKISIILPMYNAEKYIGQILEELLGQTYQNTELLIINDGSTDSSEEIVSRYAQTDDRIRLVSIPNQGPSKARNTGLDLATGDYIRFVDADDRIGADSVEVLYEPYAEDPELDLVIGSYETVPEMGYFTGDKLSGGRIDQMELIHIFLEYVKTFYFGVPWNKLYKRSIIEEKHIRFNEEIDWCEDFLFNVEYFDNIRYAYIQKSSVYRYMICDTGITLNLSKDEKKLERIDHLRYEKAAEFFKRYACLTQFERQWELLELYKRLLNLTMYRSGTVMERYRRFKEYLLSEGAYEYICKMSADQNSSDWRLLKYTVEKKQFGTAFCFFLVKGCRCRMNKTLRIDYERRNIPQ